jgi:hypothetical protein
MQTIPVNDTFGNPLIRGIEEIYLPDAVSWTPSAPGWIIIWAIMAALGAFLLIRLFFKWRENRYRRNAIKYLKILKQKDLMAEKTVLCALPRLLKHTALKAFPRARVASLFGEKWIAFLESRYQDPGFRKNAGKHLLAVSYQAPECWDINREQAEALFSLVERWIRHHRREGGP